MAGYDAAQHFSMTTTADGGVRLRFRDAPSSFLPGRSRDDEPKASTFGQAIAMGEAKSRRGAGSTAEDDETESGEKVVSLDAPPDGLTYALQDNGDGSWSVVLVPDDGTGDELPKLKLTSPHELSTTKDATLAAINRVNRARRPGAPTRDEEFTLFRHTPGPGERLELRGPDERGYFNLVLIGPDHPTVAGNTPRGGAGHGSVVSSSSAPSKDRAAPSLRTLNANNRRFYSR